MNKLFRSHDGFFRKLMSEPERARDYLNEFLPEEVKRVVDLDTLEQETGSYVDDKLRQSFSDVVFKADSRQGQPVNFCFLFEHKSHVDEKAPFQILHYISSAMLKRAENGEPQRLIIPILFYHGRSPWAYRPVENYFAGLDQELLAFLPRFDYLYHNVQGKSDEEIKEISNPLISAAILVMKHYFDQGYLLKNLEFFLVSSVDDYGNLYRPLIVYLFEKVPEGAEETLEAMSNLPSSIKSEVMSILDAYEARGKAKGEIKGISQKTRQTCINMIRKGFDNLTICEVLEVSDDYVEKVRKELNEERSVE